MNKLGTLLFSAAICCSMLVSCSDDATDPAAAPEASFIVNSEALKEWDTLTVTNTSKNAMAFNWFILQSEQSSTDAAPSWEMDRSGTYTIRLIATGAGGSDTATTTVTVDINNVFRAFGHGVKTWYLNKLTVAGSVLSDDPCYWDNTINFNNGNFTYLEGDDVCADSPIPEQSGTFDYAPDLSTVTMNITSPFVSSIIYTTSNMSAESVTVSTTFTGGAPVEMILATEKRTQ